MFYLHDDPVVCAQWHCDSHVVKMIVEYAQLLSSTHRLLDGTQRIEAREKDGKTRRIKVWDLPDSRNDVLYRASHTGHPSRVWSGETSENYLWLYSLFCALCDEYTYRYRKIHKCDSQLRGALSQLPKTIKISARTAVPLCMGAEPQCINLDDRIGSYRNFYITKQKRMKLRWRNREVPEWFVFN